ncbi:MAG: hypothetical protein EBS86_08175, partial [Crocinitomicaceae bacterium]|nr:hypothetical protein [Crocinitomicaceae bacterium]
FHSKLFFFTSFLFINFLNTFSVFSQDSLTKRKWYDDITFDGYIQVQYSYTNKADSLSLNSPNSGRFDRFVSNKFSVRRGRIQMQYQKQFVNAQFSFDVTELGFRMKDAWIALKDPKWQTFTLTAGIFTRRFGGELELSSRDREVPERSMVVQTLFPAIRDLGANLEIRLPKKYKLHCLKLDLGIFNGTGANLEADSFKDFTGRLQLENPVKIKNMTYKFGASGYLGFVNHRYDIDGSASNYRFIWKTLDTFLTVNGVNQQVTIMNQDITSASLGNVLNDPTNPIARATYNKNVQRRYYSFHGEFKYKESFGTTMIRGEYIFGQQVSLEGTLGNPYVFTSVSPVGPINSVTWPKFDSPQPYNPATVGLQLKPSHTFVRSFRAFFVYFDQQIGKTGHHIGYRIDYYDPNIDIKGNQIDVVLRDDAGNILGSSGLSVADVAFTTHLFAYRYVFNQHLSVMLTYEMPINEKTKIDPLDSIQIGLGKYPHSGFLTNIKDDVMMIRMQYRF